MRHPLAPHKSIQRCRVQNSRQRNLFRSCFSRSAREAHKGETNSTTSKICQRSDGTISYHGPEGEICKVRVVSGYGSRSLEPKTAEFQLRKMRSSITYHQVPEMTWHTDWKNPKTWFLPEGNWAKRVCIARWNSKEWKLEL